MAAVELATTYAALILADAGAEITAEKINLIVAAAGVAVEPIWATLLVKALAGRDVQELLTSVSGGAGVAQPAVGGGAVNGGPGPVVAEEVEEAEEAGEQDSDDDLIGFGLFDD